MFKILKNFFEKRKMKFEKTSDSWDKDMLKVIWKKIDRAEKSKYKDIKPSDEIIFDLNLEIEREIKKYYPHDKEKAEKMRRRLVETLRITCLKNHKSNSVRENLQCIFDTAWEDDNTESIYFRNKMYPEGKPSIEKFIADLAKNENEEIEREERIFFDVLNAVRFEGQTVDDVYKSMQEQIDETWKITDLNAIKHRNELFPKGKPSVQEFLENMVESCPNFEKTGG